MWRLSNKLGFSEAKLRRVKLRGTDVPLFLRSGRSSDYACFNQVFITEEYKPLRTIPDPLVIVDCGANVGFASRYFLQAFPHARIIAIEPEPDNIEICRLNLEPFRDRSVVIHAAVWDEVLKVALSLPSDQREWSTQVRLAVEGELPTIQAIDLASLLREQGLDKVDILKIDIEGSELRLFRDGASRLWLGLVGNLAIELHSEECAQAFFGAMSGFDYSLVKSDDLEICLGIRPKTQ